MERFNASRETVRKALERLVVKNLVIRKPGLGTFVNIEKKNKVVGILVQQITSYIFPYIALGAEEVLFANGYKMLLGNASEDPHKERQIINEWLEVGVDGLIIDPVYSATKRSNRDLIGEIAKRGTKVVLVHTNWDIEGVGSVVLDDWYGGEKAAEIFYQYGHRNVAVLYKTIHLPSVVRAQAFLKRGRELGFEKSTRNLFTFQNSQVSLCKVPLNSYLCRKISVQPQFSATTMQRPFSFSLQQKEWV